MTILDSIAFFPSRCCFGLSVCLSIFHLFFLSSKKLLPHIFSFIIAEKKEEKKKQKIADEV